MKKTGIWLLMLCLLAACQDSDKQRLTRIPLAGCSLPDCDVCRFRGLCQLQTAVAQVEAADGGDRLVVRKG